MATESVHHDDRRLTRALSLRNGEIADECDFAGFEHDPFLHRTALPRFIRRRPILRRFDTEHAKIFIVTRIFSFVSVSASD
jgi:hypothetical protein